MEILSGPYKVKARKKHRCNYCQYHILQNEFYLKSGNKAFGEVYTWKAHLKCDAIANKLNMFEECDEGVTEDDFQEYIVCEYDNLDGPKLPRGTEFKVYLDFVLSHHSIL